MEHFASFLSIAVRILSDLNVGKIWDTEYGVYMCGGNGQILSMEHFVPFVSIAVRILSDFKVGEMRHRYVGREHH